VRRKIKGELTYWNFVAIDGIIRNQLDAQQDATLKGKKLNLHVQFCSTNVSKNGVMNMGIRLYNKIPNKIMEVRKMRQFKRVFRSYSVQHVFYWVEEYMLS
jgi:hypothetical protein